jgi:hypothetical protein
MPTPFFDVLDREIERYVGKEAAGFVHGVFSLNDREELCRLLTEAGFDTPAVEPHSRPVQLPPARDFMWQYIHCTPLIALLQQSRPEDREALERAVVAGWQPWAADEGMTCEQSVLVASAGRPS